MSSKPTNKEETDDGQTHLQQMSLLPLAPKSSRYVEHHYNMAKKKNKKKDSVDQSALSSTVTSVKGSEDMINVCPSRIRYQHSRIRPYFSGCGRSVMDTMEEIRQGKLEPNALPPIQVLVGPTDDDDQGPWYFSLNNRRLWIFKQCYKEGLLERYNNTIAVRVRLPKSDAERERYCIQNCALEAKFIRESDPNNKKKKAMVKAKKKDDGKSEMDTHSKDREDTTQLTNDFSQMSTAINEEEDDGSSDESSSDGNDVVHSNPFALDESSSDDDD